jgi:hypothetical protein
LSFLHPVRVCAPHVRASELPNTHLSSLSRCTPTPDHARCAVRARAASHSTDEDDRDDEAGVAAPLNDAAAHGAAAQLPLNGNAAADDGAPPPPVQGGAAQDGAPDAGPPPPLPLQGATADVAPQLQPLPMAHAAGAGIQPFQLLIPLPPAPRAPVPYLSLGPRAPCTICRAPMWLCEKKRCCSGGALVLSENPFQTSGEAIGKVGVAIARERASLARLGLPPLPGDADPDFELPPLPWEVPANHFGGADSQFPAPDAEYVALCLSPYASDNARAINQALSFAAATATPTRAHKGRGFHTLYNGFGAVHLEGKVMVTTFSLDAAGPPILHSLPNSLILSDPRMVTKLGGEGFARQLLNFRQYLREHNPVAHALSTVTVQQLPQLCLHIRAGGTEQRSIATTLLFNNAAPPTHVGATIAWEGRPTNVSINSPLWEPLCYPLLFERGTLGWGYYGGRRPVSPNGKLLSLHDYMSAQLYQNPRVGLLPELVCVLNGHRPTHGRCERQHHDARLRALRTPQLGRDLHVSPFVPLHCLHHRHLDMQLSPVGRSKRRRVLHPIRPRLCRQALCGSHGHARRRHARHSRRLLRNHHTFSRRSRPHRRGHTRSRACSLCYASYTGSCCRWRWSRWRRLRGRGRLCGRRLCQR